MSEASAEPVDESTENQNQNQEQDQKQSPVDFNANTISLKVVSQDGNEVYFKIKKQTPIEKLMNAYCTRQAIDPNSIRFLFDGQRIQKNQTAKELDMQDDDVIDAVLQQTGGNV